VFRGTYELNEVTDVAIKRVEKERLETDRETTALQILDHENVLKWLFVTEDENFRYKFRLLLINIEFYLIKISNAAILYWSSVWQRWVNTLAANFILNCLHQWTVFVKWPKG
jgi:hypothetical protein